MKTFDFDIERIAQVWHKQGAAKALLALNQLIERESLVRFEAVILKDAVKARFVKM